MTATLDIQTLITAIAGITSITGLDILDLAEIPEQIDCRAKAQFFPDPEIFISDLVVSRVTNGGPAAAMDANYTLNYVLAYKPIEAGRRFHDYIPGVIGMIETIIETLSTTDLSASHGWGISDISVPFIGKIIDPAGNAYLGARILITVQDIVQ